jgi:ankyrin repeat protein
MYPLLSACEKGDLNKVIQIIEVEGGEIEEKDRNGCTGFIRACENGHFEIVKY